MTITKNDIIFSFALLLSLWFAVFGLVWVYNAALFIAYPFGIVSFLLWKSWRKKDKRVNRYKIIPVILITGLTLSLGMLIYLLIFE